MASSSKFTVSAQPETDLWRKPPSTDRSNPAVKSLGKVSLSSFQSAGVTFSASWTHQYDQGGIAIFLKYPNTSDKKWVKSGIEFYNGEALVGTVCTDNWSDWSLAPPRDYKPSGSSSKVSGAEGGSAGGGKDDITIEAVAEGDELGRSLWIYQVVAGEGGKEERVPLRECTWFFGTVEGVELEVAAYAARPGKATGEGDILDVGFSKAWVDGK